MKKKLFILPLISLLTLSGCKDKKKEPLVIPNVDVENITLNLPELPTYNTGDIRSDGTYDYIDLYEFSDFHGAVNYEDHSGGTYLGLKKLATYLDEKRSQNEGGTLVLSSGDMFQGSADSNLTRGYLVNYCMNYMGFDAMAVGNHEFDWTEEWLKKNAELKYNTSSVPFLGANIKKGDAMPEYLRKSVVIERGEYKIGVIGVIGSSLESSILKSAIAGFEFVPYGDIVTEEAARLRAEEDCNAVVLLAHDQADAIELFTGVDAIFGGHAHKNFPGSIQNGVPSLATKNYGQSVAHIELKFDKVTKECNVDTYGLESFGQSDSSIADNAGISNIIGQYEPEINKIKNIKLGSADEELAYDKALKNICTETMFESAKNAAASLEVDASKIVCAVTNYEGGIRDNIKAGEITYGDVYKCFPFDNEVVLIKVKGSYIKSNLTKINQLAIYRVFDKKSYFVDTEDYYMVTTDYLATADQFAPFGVFTEADLIFSGKIVRDEVAQKIYDIGSIVNSSYDTVQLPFKPLPMVWY